MGTWNPNMPRFAKVQIEASRAYNHRLREVELREIAVAERFRKLDEEAVRIQNWYADAKKQYDLMRAENAQLKIETIELAYRLQLALLINPAGPAQTVVESERSISFED